LSKDLYAKRQREFEKVVENVCYMFLFQVHESLDNIGMQDGHQSLAQGTFV